MKKIFEEYGGTIITVVAVVLLISFITTSMNTGGVLYNAFGEMINSFSEKSNGAGGSGEEIIYTDFTITAENRHMIGYTGAANENLVIPETFQGDDGTWYRVVAIGDEAFKQCTKLTGNLIIPNSITTIGERAFYGCYGFNGTLTLSNQLTTIGAAAFSTCTKLTGDLVIPNSVTSIGASAFYNCENLTGDLVIPNSVTSIGGSAFFGCSGLTGDLVIPNSVTSIKSMTFAGCSSLNGTLTISNNATSIGATAFSGCSGLTGNLIIPDSVTSIGIYAFKDCTGLSSVEFANPNGWWHASSSSATSGTNFSETDLQNPTTALTYLTSTYDEEYWFRTEQPEIEYQDFTITISNRKKIGYTSTITDLVIPATFQDTDGTWYRVVGIGDNAFEHCDSLTSVIIPDSVTSIGDYAFTGCGLTGNLVIPNSVVTIGNRAFEYCSKLTAIEVDDANPNYCDVNGMLLNKSCTTLIRCPAGKSGNLVIPNSVTTIGDYAFMDCSGLTGNLVFPESVTTIGVCAFQNCDGFTGNLVLPESLTSIGDGAFFCCTGLTGELVIPDGVTTIGNSAFHSCAGFTGSLIIPEGVTTIGDWAFYFCAGFNGTLTLPNTLTTIGEIAFCGCDGFTGNLVIPNSVTTIGSYAFAFDSYSGVTSIEFANPNGWWYADSSEATSGTNLSATVLQNPTTALTYLTSTYTDKYWFRSEG